MSFVLRIVLVLSLINGVQPQPQPCLICGGATLRIWSLMSRTGDRYLRISKNVEPRSRHYKVDFAGKLHSDNITSLLKIREKSTFRETRIQFVFHYNYQEFHLYAPSNSGGLLAMPANQGIKETDHRNTFAPERLLYDHRLFTVFQSVKFRGYYLSCDGSGKTSLKPIINKAYRDPAHLFLTIDPGNVIRGVTFGSLNNLERGKRTLEKPSLHDDYTINPYQPQLTQPPARPRNTQHKPNPSPSPRPKIGTPRATRRCVSPRPKATLKTRPATSRRPVSPQSRQPLTPTHSAVTSTVNLPDKITFVLCFWIKTLAKSGQLMSLAEHVTESQREYWRKRHYSWVYNYRVINYNIFSITIYQGYLKFEIGHRRVVREVPHCIINDNKFHHVCISLDDQYIMDVYKNGKNILRQNMQQVSCDFVEKKSNDRRRGTFTLGKPRSMSGEAFMGSLFQVNLWDQYPSFRIQRIATNCACGGGSLMKWSDLLNGTITSVTLSDDAVCPKLQGYNYDELTQNHLI